MQEKLIEYLQCLGCQSDLAIEDVEYADGEIKSGRLQCSSCERSYPIIDFIPTFLKETEDFRWRSAWSYKWTNVAKRVRYSEDGDYDFELKINYNKIFDEKIKGKLVLDAGCGSGQDMARVAKLGARVIGVDQSQGVHFARKYNVDQPYFKNMLFIRADIFDLPLKKDIFDIIYSNGVLHHTPDTKRAFDSLPSLLKKGGEIAIWVYDKTQYWRLFETFWRPVLCRLPRPLISFILHSVNRPWYWIYRYRMFFMEKVNPWPKSSAARNIFDFLCLGQFLYLLTDYHLHIAVTCKDHFVRYHHAFDCYSPYYAWGHDESELFAWFKEHNVEVTDISERRSGMTGRKL